MDDPTSIVPRIEMSFRAPRLKWKQCERTVVTGRVYLLVQVLRASLHRELGLCFE
jgi:hypothetical protein